MYNIQKAVERGVLIKAGREAKGLTQGELGKRLNVADTAISKYEKGLVLNIPLEKRLKIATILELPAYLFCDSEELQMIKNLFGVNGKNEI